MRMEQERRQIVSYGKRLAADGLTAGTAGNLSVYDPARGLMAISPSGIPYAETAPEDVVVMDLEGNVAEGKRTPSSEAGLHAVIYRTRPEARAVVHGHAMFCTTLACLGLPLRPVHYALAEAFTGESGRTEVPVVRYELFGTDALAAAVGEQLDGGCRAFLLANHGMVAYGESLPAAYGLAQTCEWCAQLQWRCLSAGVPTVLTPEQLRAAARRYQAYGQPDDERFGYNG